MPDFWTRLLTAQHRVLRLIMAVGAVAVGLCVVLAMVALVARLGDSPARTVAKTSSLGSSYPRTADADPGRTADVTLARFFGGGSGERAFMLRTPGRIAVAWSYRCRPGRPARFVLGEALVPAGLGLDQDRTGLRGAGRTMLTEHAGRHVLVVVSDCAWAIRVLRH